MQRRLFQLRSLADLHFAAIVPLLDLRPLFEELVQAVSLDKAEVEYLRVMRQDVGPVCRRIQLGAGEIRTLEAEIESAFVNAGICFTGTANHRAVPFECSATSARQAFLLEPHRQQTVHERWVVLHHVGSAFAAVDPARRDHGNLIRPLHVITSIVELPATVYHYRTEALIYAAPNVVLMTKPQPVALSIQAEVARLMW